MGDFVGATDMGWTIAHGPSGAGAHCFCGASADHSSAAAEALARPKAECIVPTTPCDGDKSEKECGGPGRMLAYAFTCDLSAA
jgi:hypothetical protein